MPKEIHSASVEIGGITKPALLRLCHRVGIPRVGGLVYEVLRTILLTFLEEYLVRVVTFTEKERKKTISVNHAYAGMGPTKVKLSTKDLEKCKPKSKISETCLTIPKAPFLRLLQGVIGDIKKDLRLEQDASILIQYYAEMFLLKLLAMALKITVQAERKTVKHNDVILARDTLMLQS